MSTDRTDGAGLTLETITTPAALASAAPDWRALWARCPDATPFQSPEWILPWWECRWHPEIRRNRRRRLRCRALARERHRHPLHPSLKQAHENLQTRPQ